MIGLRLIGDVTCLVICHWWSYRSFVCRIHVCHPIWCLVEFCTRALILVQAIPMKFASVANIVKRYNRKMYVWNELIFYKTWILTMFAASLRHVTLILCAIAHIYTLVAIWRIGTHRYTVWSNPSWFTSYEKSHRLTEKFCI